MEVPSVIFQMEFFLGNTTGLEYIELLYLSAAQKGRLKSMELKMINNSLCFSITLP
jgi:hypothetical protein